MAVCLTLALRNTKILNYKCTILRPRDKIAVCLTLALSNTKVVKLAVVIFQLQLLKKIPCWNVATGYIPNAKMSKERFPVKNVS